MPKTILVADDSVTIRKIVELAFVDSDIRVETAANGDEALRRLAGAGIDLILADVVMPGPSGYDLCQRVKEADAGFPVVLLAGTFEPFDPELARECGADAHLVKPFESRHLLETVEGLLFRPPAPDREPEPEPVPEPASPAEPADEGTVPDTLEEVFGDLQPAGPDWTASEGSGVEEVVEELAAAGPGQPEPRSEPPVQRASVEEPVAPAHPDEARVPGLEPEQFEALVRAVVQRMSNDVVREVAWEVIPEAAERLIRERIRELESEEFDDEPPR